ncbi:SusD/RagB family nutrient-binding outer membrane lipoprotein [Sphingobacterium sp. E70]|uniref:SusD/RagB family nutrient-binding outer membrane lipoprotein n=1 Tax=Sphingobacterium sp. E70 TaxID=2853439 RepID=UPI0027961D50|nr:SusD/RagB family nutrient-binding outer membrane lipoprotein [Sphingobacterium sp. E70]
MAEAIIRFGVAGNAQTFYEAGIKASMNDAKVTSSDINKFFADNATTVTLSGSNEKKIEQIITQKYIAQFANGLEQWNDWRRTGYPVLAPHQNAGG